MLIKDVLQKSTEFLKNKGVETPRLDAELLISNFLNLKRIDLYLRFEQPLSEAEIQVCREVVTRRGRGEPVAYILGKKDFYGRTFTVDKNVLIPRPETEILVELVFNHIKNHSMNNGTIKIIDLGAGSGAIGVTLGLEIENSHITLVDISESALGVTQKNIDNLFKSNESFKKFRLVQSDIEELEINEKFDVVVSNPPYIDKQTHLISEEVRMFEPHIALFSDDNGFYAIKQWLEKALSFLNKQGFIIFEIGFDQGEKAKELFESKKCFSEIEIIKDLAGYNRFIKAVFNG